MTSNIQLIEPFIEQFKLFNRDLLKKSKISIGTLGPSATSSMQALKYMCKTLNIGSKSSVRLYDNFESFKYNVMNNYIHKENIDINKCILGVDNIYQIKTSNSNKKCNIDSMDFLKRKQCYLVTGNKSNIIINSDNILLEPMKIYLFNPVECKNIVLNQNNALALFNKK